jgi:hypothetical protein
LAKAAAAELASQFDVQIQSFSAGNVAESLDALGSRNPDGQTTDLAGAITGALAESRPQGQAMLLVSDGIHNAEAGTERILQAVAVAKALDCPIFTKAIGGDTVVADVGIVPRSPLELAYVGQTIQSPIVVRQRGRSGGEVELALQHDGKVVEQKKAAVGASGEAEVFFPLKGHRPGSVRYEVQAKPITNEIALSNNVATLVLRVVDQPIRILLLEGKPYWDAKFLVRTLLANSAVELDSLVRVTGSRFHHRSIRKGADAKSANGNAGASGGSEAREKWETVPSFAEFASRSGGLQSYQILVLGRDAEAFLTDERPEQIRTWLARDGGSLVCFRGQPSARLSQRLAQLLPVQWSPTRETRFRPQWTERGKELRWLAGESLELLPALVTTSRPDNPRPLTTVLASSAAKEGTSPVMSWQPYGAGRVVVIEGAGMWRWAFLPPEQQSLDGAYRTLWDNLLRWLATSADLLPGQELALRMDKVSFGAGESAAGMLLVRDASRQSAPPVVELQSAALPEPRTLRPVPLEDDPNAFRVVFGKLPEGSYHAKVAGAAGNERASAAFDVRVTSDEQLDLKARPDLLARIAQESGGVALSAERLDETVGQLVAGITRSRPEQVRTVPAWDRWWVLLIVFGIWGLCWATRRSSGLV